MSLFDVLNNLMNSGEKISETSKYALCTYTDQEYEGDRYKEYSVAKYLFVMAIIHTRRRWNRINKHAFPPHVLFVLGEPVEPGGGGVVRDGGVDHAGLLLPPPVRGPGR